jgi:penicillin V acylase-like amidase (Ntn superfamily)
VKKSLNRLKNFAFLQIGPYGYQKIQKSKSKVITKKPVFRKNYKYLKNRIFFKTLTVSLIGASYRNQLPSTGTATVPVAEQKKLIPRT